MDQNRNKDVFDKARKDFFNVNRQNPPPVDNRHVYSIRCSWNGSISKVRRNGSLPACPHCKAMLFEMPADKWLQDVNKFAEENSDSNYPKFIEWLANRGTCSPLRNNEHVRLLRVQFDSL